MRKPIRVFAVRRNRDTGGNETFDRVTVARFGMGMWFEGGGRAGVVALGRSGNHHPEVSSDDSFAGLNPFPKAASF